MLPDGERIPVTILYEPVVRRTDAITLEPFIEVFHDVYGRMRDKTQHLDDVAAQIGAVVPGWLRLSLREPFRGSFIVSNRPRVENNGQVVAIGALESDNGLFLPLAVMERLLGEKYAESEGQARLGGLQLAPADVLVYNAQLFLRGGLIAAKTGRGYFYDELQNAVQLALTRLVVNGTTVAYNSVFVHPELGPLVSADDLARALGATLRNVSPGIVLLNGQRLNVHRLGTLTFVALTELRRVVPNFTWSLGHGALEIVTP